MTMKTCNICDTIYVLTRWHCPICNTIAIRLNGQNVTFPKLTPIARIDK